MPYNSITNVFTRLWKFVDQFVTGDEITRADLDVALDDFTPAINAALQARADASRVAANVGLAFDTLAELQGDSSLTYATGSERTVATGSIIFVRREQIAFEVAEPDVVSSDMETTGGVKLYHFTGGGEAAFGRAIIFPSIATLTADTALSYSGAIYGAGIVGQNVFCALEGRAFTILANTALSPDITTAGGIKLGALPSYVPVMGSPSTTDGAVYIESGTSRLAYKAGSSLFRVRRAGVLVAGDAAVSLSATSSPETVVYNAPITAARTVSLPGTPFNGQRFRIARTAAATGAFSVEVTGVVFLSAGEWCDIEYSGSSWIITAQGTL